MIRSEKGSWTLVGLLVVVVLIGLGAYFYLGSGSTVSSESQLLDQASEKKTVVGKSIDTAKAADCRQRLDQLRKGILTYKTTDPSVANPATLQDMQLGVSNDYYQCPVSQEPYIYDANSGTVRCKTHTDF